MPGAAAQQSPCVEAAAAARLCLWPRRDLSLLLKKIEKFKCLCDIFQLLNISQKNKLFFSTQGET